MSIEEAIMGGIVFKGKKDKPQEDEKVKTKAKKATYIRGQHGSGAAKMKADIVKCMDGWEQNHDYSDAD